MPQKAERRGAGAVKAEPPAAPHAFEEVRNTLVRYGAAPKLRFVRCEQRRKLESNDCHRYRAAADSQSNEVTEKILNKFLTTAANLTAERCSGRLAVEVLALNPGYGPELVCTAPAHFHSSKLRGYAGDFAGAAVAGLRSGRPHRLPGLHPFCSVDGQGRIPVSIALLLRGSRLMPPTRVACSAASLL